MKEIEDNTDGKIYCAWTGRINIVKMTIHPKVIYRSNAIPIKILEKIILKFVWKQKDPE